METQTAWVIWHPKPQAFLPNTTRETRMQCIIEAMFQHDRDGWLRLSNEEIEAKWREWEADGIRCVKVRLVEEEAGDG